MKNVIFTLVAFFSLIGCAPQDGLNGMSGEDGYSSLLWPTRYEEGLGLCSSGSGVEIQTGLDKNRNFILDYQEVNYVTVVCDGVSEENQPIPLGISAFIDPCGPEGSFDEVIMQMTDGTLLTHYSHGGKQFLTVLTDGNYQTTDGTKCNFSVSDGIVNW